MSSSSGSIDAIRSGVRLERYLPEPRSRLQDVAGSAIKSAVGVVSGMTVGIDPIYQDLLEKQLQIQTQMQLVTMTSNIEKSKHETEMAAIRNIRVG